MQVLPRREVWEHGFLPLHALCPQLDGLGALQALHVRLVDRSSLTPGGQWTISPADLGAAMELTGAQLDILCEVLGALSVLNGASPGRRPAAGFEELFAHEVSLFLFVLLFSKETQRGDTLEVWPEAGPPGAIGNLDGLLSPTRAMTVRTTVTGKASTRQQLQSNLRHQALQLRSFGDYVKRNLRAIVELCLDQPVGRPAPVTPAPAPAAAGQPAPPGLATAVSQRLVTALELDRLAMVLSVSGGGRQGGPPISSVVPGLSARGASMPLDLIVATLRQSWHEEVPQSPRIGASPTTSAALLLSPATKMARAPGMVASTGQVDDASISGVCKGTVVRGESEVPHTGLRISDCHECVAYVLAPLQSAYICGCSESTIVLGAVGGLVRAERCEKLTLIVAAARVVISNCHDCVLHLGTPRPPMLIGDCRFVRLAPFNTRYERQLAHVAATGLCLDAPNRWDSPLVLGGKDRRPGPSGGGAPDSPVPGALGGVAGGVARTGLACTYSLVLPDELLPFVIPFQGSAGALAGGPAHPHTTNWKQLATSGGAPQAGGGSPASGGAGGQGGPLYLYPLPPEYERALHRKLAMTGDMRQRFRQACLGKERETELNNAIQAYFREWLSNCNLLRQIYDLSNLEKEDVQGGGTDVLMQAPPPPRGDRTSLSL